MSDEIFSMKPTSQGEMDDLAANGIDWIKAKLAKAELHVRNVQEIRQLATEQGLSDEDYYALLAYRSVTELIDVVTATARQVQLAEPEGVVLSPTGEVLRPESDDLRIIT